MMMLTHPPSSRPVQIPAFPDERPSSVRRINPLITGARPVVLNATWPTINFLCKPIGIAAGPAIMVAGVGYSAKSLFCQLFALSVVSGQPFLDRYPVRRGRVLHLDYEQGRNESFVRYRRLCEGAGLAQHDLDGLHYIEHPNFKLDQPDAEELLTEAVQGHALCLIDSFRAAVSGDENDSGSRANLDLLARVSERTSCTFLLIHHAGKTSPKDKRFVPRGSSALFDSCANVLVLDKQNDDSVRVIQTKSRNVRFDGICFRLEDVGDVVEATGRSSALKLVAFDQPPSPPDHAERIIQVLEAAPDRTLPAAVLWAKVGGNKARYLTARKKLINEGFVRLVRKGRENSYFLDQAAE